MCVCVCARARPSPEPRHVAIPPCEHPRRTRSLPHDRAALAPPTGPRPPAHAARRRSRCRSFPPRASPSPARRTKRCPRRAPPRAPARATDTAPALHTPRRASRSTCGTPKKASSPIRGELEGEISQGSGGCWGWGGALRSGGRERGLQEGTAGLVDSPHVELRGAR
eukprot:3908535-Prymnesium_polylepis.1